MPGLFEPQKVAESSLSGEGFVQSPTASISGKAISDVASTALNTYGVIRSNIAGSESREIQENFLRDLEAQRADTDEADQIERKASELDEASPGDLAVLGHYEERLKTLNSAINSRRVNPSEALTRIEAAKNEAINQAPFMEARIRRMTSIKGTTFESETDQLIKQTNDLKNFANNELGLNPEIAGNLIIARAHQQAAANAKLEANLGVLEGVKANKAALGIINSAIDVQTAVIQDAITAVGGIENLGAEQQSAIVTQLTSFTNGNENVIVERLLAGNPDIDSSRVPQGVKDDMANKIKGSADSFILQFNGSIPRTTLENTLASFESRVLSNIHRDAPGLARDLVIISKVPEGTAVSGALDEVAAQSLTSYAEGIGLGELNRLNKNGLLAAGVKNPKEIQDMVAGNMSDIREFIQENPEKMDVATARGHFRNIRTNIEAIVADPKGFSPVMFDEMLEHISSDEISSMYARLDPNDHERYESSARNMIQLYASENMAVDLSKELNKRASFGPASPLTVGDLVSTRVTDEGFLEFLPNTGFFNAADDQAAIANANRLTKMYSGRSAAVIRAGKAIVAPGVEGTFNAKEFGVRIYSNALQGTGETLREEGAKLTQTGIIEAIRAAREARERGPKIDLSSFDAIKTLNQDELDTLGQAILDITGKGQ